MINDVLDVMTEPAKEGMTMLVVTREMGFSKCVADRVVFMNAGRIEEVCSNDSFLEKGAANEFGEFLSKILSH